MSGFEVVGVVFAVLPLFIEAGKAYVHHGSALHKAVKPSIRDDKLVDFYESFWWETFELRKQIEKVVTDLPQLSEERKNQIISSRDIDGWDKSKDVGQALREFFATEDDYLAFQKVMSKILDMLARLVKDDTVHISRSEKDQTKMYQKLKRFQQGQDSGSFSTYWERVKFLKREKDRETCLKNLQTWNKRVGIMIDSACKAAERRKAVSTSHVGPSPQRRTLSSRLFSALSKCWFCDCDSSHEAHFSLACCGSQKQDPGEAGILFDFLISHPHRQTTWTWREGTVVIKSASKDSQQRVKVDTICGAVQKASTADHCLQLLVEDLESSQTTWRLSWREPKLNYLRTKSAVSLKMLLQGFRAPPLVERRRLALVLTYSVLQLHESPWLSEQWDKERMHFFYDDVDRPDFKRPYLSTFFDQFPSKGEPPNMDRFHKNPGILKLGVLLIEVHKWKPLEGFRRQDDLVNDEPTPNTDLHVARRVLKTLDDCFPTYRGAIEACLGVPWVHSGSRVSLEDAETRNGLYGDVIEPLEREVALGDYD